MVPPEGPPDSNLKAMLSSGASLLWDPIWMGKGGDRVLKVTLGNSKSSIHVGNIIASWFRM